MQPSSPELEALERALIRTVKGMITAGPGERPDLDRASYMVLGALTHLGPSRLSDLAHHLQLDLSTVSRQARQLIDSGHVGRTPDPDDGRASLLSVSPVGSSAMTVEQRRRHGTLAAALADLSPAETVTLVGLLTRVSHHFAPAPSPAQPSPSLAERSS